MAHEDIVIDPILRTDLVPRVVGAIRQEFGGAELIRTDLYGRGMLVLRVDPDLGPGVGSAG